MKSLLLRNYCLFVGSVFVVTFATAADAGGSNDELLMSRLIPDDMLLFDTTEIIKNLKTDFQPNIMSSLPTTEKNKDMESGGSISTTTTTRRTRTPPTTRRKQRKTTTMTTSSHEKRRKLETSTATETAAAAAEDDFDSFTALIHDAVFQLPDFEASERIGFFTMGLNVFNLLCSNTTFGDLDAYYRMEEGNKRLTYNLDMKELDIMCEFDFGWTFSLLSDGGHGTVHVKDSAATTVMAFFSQNFDTHPPHNITTESCDSELNIDDLEFTGSVTSAILSAFEMLIAIGIERSLTDVVCDELSAFSANIVGDIVEFANEMFNNYSRPVDQELLALQDDQDNHDNKEVQIVNIRTYYGEIGQLILDVMDDALSFLGSSTTAGTAATAVAGPTTDLFSSIETVMTTTSEQPDDLRINSLLRAFLLEDDGGLELDAQSIPGVDTVLLKGHNEFTEWSMALDRMKIFGLDTFRKFNPILDFANNTYQIDVNWATMTIDAYLDVFFKPSTLPDSIISSKTTTKVRENVKISITVDNVDVVLAMLIAIDEHKFDQLELGSFLFIENILPCALSSVHRMLISKFEVSVDHINDPIVSGFVSSGLEDVLTTSVLAAFDMYESVLRQSLPTIMQNFFNDMVTTYMSGSGCKDFTPSQSYIDFRDLLLSQKDAEAYGGSGEAPYGDVIHYLYELVRENLFRIHPSTGLAAINDILVAPFTQSQSGETGTILLPVDIAERMNFEVGGTTAAFGFRLNNMQLKNVHYIGEPFSLLDTIPYNPYHLKNTATFGIEEVPLVLSVRIALEMLKPDGTLLSNEVDFGLHLHAFTAVLTALLKIPEENIMQFPLRDIFNTYCWLSTPMRTSASPNIMEARISGSSSSSNSNNNNDGPTFGITHFSAMMEKIKLSLSCVECTSPKMHEMVDLINAPEMDDDFTDIGNQIQEYITNLVDGSDGGAVGLPVERMLHIAAGQCPHRSLHNETLSDLTLEAFLGEVIASTFGASDSAYDDVMMTSSLSSSKSSISNIADIVAILACLAVVVGLIVLVVRYFVHRRHKRWLNTLPKQQLRELFQQQKAEDTKESGLNVASQSMFQSREVIPPFVCYLIPVVIVGNIALFLSGHLNIGGAVHIEGQIAGESIRFENFYEFSIASSTIDLFKAGGTELAILILIFSVIWPYTKQLITLALWFVPPTQVSISLRGSILLWLDFLAKWSMVDVFALVVSLSAFRVQVFSPSWSFLPDSFYEGNLMVVPKWGLYANMTAQLVSQISSHFIIFYHRQIYSRAVLRFRMKHDTVIPEAAVVGDSEAPANFASADSFASEDTDQKEQLCYHEFVRPHRHVQQQYDANDDDDEGDNNNIRLVIRRFVNTGLVVVACLLSLFLILGCIFPSYTLEMLGIVGLFVEAGQSFEEAKIDHSVFSIVQLIMDQARILNTPSDYIGLGALSSLTILCVLVVPLAQTFALLYQWLYPMTKRLRGRVSVFIEILQAWQYAEVYVISIIVASWQLAPTSEAMINSYCQSLTSTFDMFESLGLIDSRDAQCFQLDATIGVATYFLILSSCLLALLNTFIMNATTQYVRDHEKESSTSTGSDNNHHDDMNDDNKLINKIRLPMVLFTDKFRWFLTSTYDNSYNNGKKELQSNVVVE